MHNAPAASIGNALMTFTNAMIIHRRRQEACNAAVIAGRQQDAMNRRLRSLEAGLAKEKSRRRHAEALLLADAIMRGL